MLPMWWPRWNYQSLNKRMQKIGTEGVQGVTRNVGKVIHWEMCKKFKFDNAKKWYMHNRTPVLENDTQTLMELWYTNGSPNLGQKTGSYNNQQKMEICKSAKLSTSLSWKNVKREISTSTLQENWNTMEYDGDTYTNYDWCSWHGN